MENAIIQGHFKITLSEGIAIANNENSILVLPTGTRFNLSNNYSITSFKGETIFTSLYINCEDQDFIVLYEGPVKKIISNTNNKI